MVIFNTWGNGYQKVYFKYLCKGQKRSGTTNSEDNNSEDDIKQDLQTINCGCCMMLTLTYNQQIIIVEVVDYIVFWKEFLQKFATKNIYGEILLINLYSLVPFTLT